ncbi:MAG: VCBS repeat-containing protein, partial [Verrucomicrobiota bacterium]|nr:VCBS repeat-containing protein [Verrucomicrobiota bacterium]
MKKSICILFTLASMGLAVEPKFRTQEIDAKIGIGYGLQLTDMNGDKKPDIILCDKDKVVWYENPTWTKHQISGHLTQRDHVCIAARDLDGDGKAELAVGAQWNIGETTNVKTSGSIFYLNPTANRKGDWAPIRLPHEPTTHRMHWVKSGEGKFDLIVKPLHGRGNKGGKGDGMKV